MQKEEVVSSYAGHVKANDEKNTISIPEAFSAEGAARVHPECYPSEPKSLGKYSTEDRPLVLNTTGVYNNDATPKKHEKK